MRFARVWLPVSLLLGPLLACPLAHAAGRPAARASTSAARVAARGEVLPFIADDYDRALALARARKLPLFIESWAPW